MKRIKKAVIPAAGLGTRFLPATKAQPKEMLPLVDTPTIQFIVEEAVASGIEDIIIITGRTKKAIEDHFDRSVELELELQAKGNDEMLERVRRISNLANIHYIRQKEARGLGHAIACARSFIGNEPFAVLLGDDVVRSETPALLQLITAYEKTGGAILGVQEVPRDQVNRYGIILAKQPGPFAEVSDLIEKPDVDKAPSATAILGRYILTPGIFSALEQTKPGRNGEIQLTDALRMLLLHEKIFACAFQGKRFDVGDKLGFVAATVEYALSREDLRKDVIRFLVTIAEKDSELRSVLRNL